MSKQNQPKQHMAPQAKHQSIAVHQSYTGPIPPAAELEKYNSIDPTFASRLILMAEKEQNNRHSKEDQFIDLEKIHQVKTLRMKSRGQLFGFVISILGIGSSVYLALTDHDAIAGVLAGSTLVSLVAVFVLGEIWKKKQEE